MNIPPFWARERLTDTDENGRTETFTACGWSFHSLEQARSEAKSRARRIFDLLTSGQKPKAYEYGDRPIREEIADSIDIGSDQPVIITRNRYGALVLNTPSVFFADVDFPQPVPGGFVEAMLWLFMPGRKETRRQNLREHTLSRIDAWSIRNPDHRFRLYRTHSGLRLLFIDRLYEPGSEEVSRILTELGSDPLYKKLTEKQKCYRARLTAKPWRCGVGLPPSSFPWDDSESEQSCRRWETKYTDVCQGFTTCVLTEKYSANSNHPVVGHVVRIHDQWACQDSSLPFA